MAEHKHSRSYHRYFENYVEREVPTENGGYRIERVYVGHYYKVSLTDEKLRRQKFLFAILFVFSAAGYLAGALLSGVSAVSFVAVATMPPLICVLFLGTAIFYRLTAPREMEIRSYRDSSENLLRGSMAFLICMIICFGATLVFCLLPFGYSFLETLPSLLFYLIAIFSSAAIRRMEKNTIYETLPPKKERPEKSSPIRYDMPE